MSTVDPGRAGIRLADEIVDADLLVAADGVRSRWRALLFPGHPGPVYSGSTVLRAITAEPADPGTDFELTWGPGAEFGHIAFRDGRAEWHAVLDAPAGVRHADPLAAVRARFGGWHDPIPALLDATRPADVLHHDVHELRTPLPRFTSGRVALLGDAAHAMTPNIGQGACQALEDAVTLAAALSACPTVEAGLARYDAERRPRSQAVARAARQAGRLGHGLRNPVAIALRNTAFRLTPPAPLSVSSCGTRGGLRPGSAEHGVSPQRKSISHRSGGETSIFTLPGRVTKGRDFRLCRCWTNRRNNGDSDVSALRSTAAESASCLDSAVVRRGLGRAGVRPAAPRRRRESMS